MSRARLFLPPVAAVVLAALAAPACTGTMPSGPATPTARAARAPSACPPPSDAKLPTVLAVDWSDGDRVALADVMASGIAVVRYDCDGVEVLRDCAAEGHYAYAGVSPARGASRIEDREQLKATLPLAGADLRKTIERGDTVDLAWIIVGQLATAAPVRRPSLRGNCAVATHAVRAANLGAFAVSSSKAGSTANAGFGLLGTGPMAKTEAAVERTGGELSSCYLSEFGGGATSPIPKCRSLVSLLLVPLVEDAEPADPLAGATADERSATEAPESATENAAPRVADRQTFETWPIKNPCKIGLRAATKDGACIRPDSGAPFMCDFTEIEECRTQCEKGDGKSCYNAAAALLDTHLNPGRGDARPEAFPWLVKGCTHGYARACGNAGQALRNGVAVPKDVAKGLQMLRDGCTAGDGLACMVLARAALLGDGMAIDIGQARAQYARACALGMRGGCAEMGEMLEQGIGGARDIAGAIGMFERACSDTEENSCRRAKSLAETEAARGGAGAKVTLDDHRVVGGMAPWPTPCKAAFRADERSSTCIAPDPSRSFVCEASLFEECKQQCEKGSARSCWNAAVNRHANSRGSRVAGLAEEATRYLDRACRGGFVPACTQQALAFLYGQGVKKDPEQARAMLEKACGSGEAPACEALGRGLTMPTTGFPRDARRGAVFLEKACELGADKACGAGVNALATSVPGVYQDPSRALRLLDGACKAAPAEPWCRRAAQLRADGATP